MSITEAARVHPNEKAWVCRELEEYDAGQKSMRRVQYLYFVRDGEMRVSKADLGPAIRWPGVGELRVVSLGEDTVAEILESIAAMRQENKASKLLAERGPSTLIDDYRRYSNERWELMHNRSVFGPGYKKERNLFARRRKKYADRT